MFREQLGEGRHFPVHDARGFRLHFPIAFDDLQAEVSDLGAAPHAPVTVVTKFP